MKYIELYNYLRNHEELTFVQSVRSIINIRNFDPEIKKALAEWAQTGNCNIQVANVSFNDLKSVAEMKPIRAFKMLDWLKREPELAHMYLRRMMFKADQSKIGNTTIATKIEEIDKSDIEL